MRSMMTTLIDVFIIIMSVCLAALQTDPPVPAGRYHGDYFGCQINQDLKCYSNLKIELEYSKMSNRRLYNFGDGSQTTFLPNFKINKMAMHISRTIQRLFISTFC